MENIKAILEFFMMNKSAERNEQVGMSPSTSHHDSINLARTQGHRFDISQVTQQAIDMFFMSKKSNGEIAGLSYWQTANGYTSIALHDLWQNKTDNAAILNELISQMPLTHQGTFINSYNDDSMWWAICLLEAYKLSPDQHWYLDTARQIWSHVNKYVIPAGKYIIRGMDMDGGVLWTSLPNEGSVNSITTGLFAELSARLAIQFHDDEKVDWDMTSQHLVDASARSLNWIFRCRFREADDIILDTININTNETVDWTFTYTTGQTIAACLALNTAIAQTKLRPTSPTSTNISVQLDPTNPYFTLATKLVNASLTRTNPAWLNSNGILTESESYGPSNHNASQNDDAVGFKSILLRSLAKYLHHLHPFRCDDENNNSRRTDINPNHDIGELNENITEFIFKQFKTILQKDTNGSGHYGPWWDGPMDLPTSHSQLAILDVMSSIGLVSRGRYDVGILNQTSNT